MISAPGTSTWETLFLLLVVHDLHVGFITRDGTVRALNGLSVSVDAGQVLAILGEAGSGKSDTLRSILGLHPRGNTRVTGQVLLKGHDVNAMGFIYLRSRYAVGTSSRLDSPPDDPHNPPAFHTLARAAPEAGRGS
jgi:ABC-type dipeptide/oligopeptide/nickel transport system ATPase component